MHRDDEVNGSVMDNLFDCCNEAMRIDVRRRHPVRAFYGAREAADVVVHRVDDIDRVREEVELPREVNGHWKAPIGEEDIESVRIFVAAGAAGHGGELGYRCLCLGLCCTCA